MTPTQNHPVVALSGGKDARAGEPTSDLAWLRYQVFSLCEETEDKCAAMAGHTGEGDADMHARGFARGRIYEAKGIRRAIGVVVGARLAERREGDDVEQLRKRIAELESLVYVPGLWRCAKCKFQLVQSCIRADDGAVGLRDDPGEICPNCNAPLWRVTERDAGNELVDRGMEQIERAERAEARVRELEQQLAGSPSPEPRP
jgi:rubrerythrin